MKKLFYLLLLFPLLLNSQTRLLTKSGIVGFEASVPSFEEVKAKNTAVTCVINTTNGDIAALALMRGFRFKIALMEEHFNENYVESDKYPKATFKGKIENFDIKKLSSTPKNYIINGVLTMHGKSKNISINAAINSKASGLEIHSEFVLNSDDFDIEIPSIVSNKVSKKVNVTLDFELK